MLTKLLLGLAMSLISGSCVAQVVPASTHPRLSTSLWRGDELLVGRLGSRRH